MKADTPGSRWCCKTKFELHEKNIFFKMSSSFRGEKRKKMLKFPHLSPYRLTGVPTMLLNPVSQYF